MSEPTPDEVLWKFDGLTTPPDDEHEILVGLREAIKQRNEARRVIRDMHWFANRAECFEHEGKPYGLIPMTALTAILKVSETYPEAWESVSEQGPQQIGLWLGDEWTPQYPKRR